jgi:hypothetical protein
LLRAISEIKLAKRQTGTIPHNFVQDENRKVRKETSAQKFKKSEEIQDTTDK